jgi:hypothetical protein
MDRFCSARRSVAGAFMSLTEREMKACSMRDPFDLVSGEKLIHFDRTLAEKSRHRTQHSMFNIKEDLESEDKPLAAFEATTEALIESAKKDTPP